MPGNKGKYLLYTICLLTMIIQEPLPRVFDNYRYSANKQKIALYESGWKIFILIYVLHSGVRGPPGIPGPSNNVNMIKGPIGLVGRRGKPGHPGLPGNGAVS